MPGFNGSLGQTSPKNTAVIGDTWEDMGHMGIKLNNW
jgi:hypothetical protein